MGRDSTVAIDCYRIYTFCFAGICSDPFTAHLHWKAASAALVKQQLHALETSPINSYTKFVIREKNSSQQWTFSTLLSRALPTRIKLTSIYKVFHIKFTYALQLTHKLCKPWQKKSTNKLLVCFWGNSIPAIHQHKALSTCGNDNMQI